MIYVVIGNVLLINLLIAMFSSTYEQVQENADQIWKFNRYKLVYEYVNVPILPPPLSLLSYMAFYLKSFFKMIANYLCRSKMKKSLSHLSLCG
jgi:transient receptor potential cation channel subfamily M protein 5